MENNICPYLGLIDDPRTCATYPDGANACHNIKPPALLAFDHQRTTCLQATHRDCPGYVNGWKDGIPRTIRRQNPIIPPSIREGLAWMLLAIPVLLFIWAGFTGRLGFLSLDFRAGAANTPTSLPFFTRTPTVTFTPTEVFTPTTTATETLTPTATPTSTQTDIRTVTVTGTPRPTATATRFVRTVAPGTPVPTRTPTQPPPPPPPTQPPPTQPPPTQPPPTNTPPLPTPET